MNLEQTVQNSIPWTQLGLSVVFLVMVWYLWKKIEEKDLDAKNDKKILIDLVEKSSLAINNNSNMMVANTEATKANSDATKLLADRVFEALVQRAEK